MSENIRPPYGPELDAVFSAMPIPPLFTDESLPVLRPLYATGVVLIEDALAKYDVAYEERTVDGPDGNQIVLSVIRPSAATEDAKAIYSIHAGGMIAGDRFACMADYDMIGWVERWGVVLVTPEYRLAPDFAAPAGVEDCYAGLVWLSEHASELGIDPGGIVVEGISGGGGLAAGTVLMARDRNGPPVLAQMLITPQLDDRNDSASALQYSAANGIRSLWPLENNEYAWDALLGKGHSARDDVSIYVSPARANDLSRLPAAFIETGSAEVFRDPAVDYARRLWAAGVQAELHIWAGGFHGFELTAPLALVSVGAREARDNWMERLLA